MTYKPVQLKILNPEEFVDFKYKNEECDGKLILTMGYATKTPSNELPITFALRYRIFCNGKHASTFMSDYKYKASFQFNETPIDELFVFVGKVMLYFIEKFYDTSKANTAKTPIEIFSDIPPEFILQFANDILREGQSQCLIEKHY